MRKGNMIHENAKYPFFFHEFYPMRKIENASFQIYKNV